MKRVLRRIESRFDRASQCLWVMGEFADGYQFAVGFPIAHVAVTFDQKLAELGYHGAVCAGVVSIEGFSNEMHAVMNSGNVRRNNASRHAYRNALTDIMLQGVHYGAHGRGAVIGSIFGDVAHAVGSAASGVAHAASSVVTTAVNAAARPLTSAAHLASAVASGDNVLQALKSEANNALGDLKRIAPIAQTVASMVPGAGTLASVAIGATQAALSGKSMTEIVKAAGVSAIPGGPLAQQVARAGLNTVQAGIEGKNVLKSAAEETIKSVASAIPDPTARDLVQRVALDAASGKNVLSSAERAAAEAAVNAISDPNARSAAAKVLAGDVNPSTMLATLAKGVVGGQLPTDAVSKILTDTVSRLPALPNGTQLLNNARNELVEVASNFVTNPAVRDGLKNAIANGLAGKKTLPGVAIMTLMSVKEPAAKAVLQQLMNGVNDPKQLLDAAGPKFVASVLALDPNSHIGQAIASAQNVITGPSGITGPVRRAVAAPGTSSIPVSSRFAAFGAPGLAALWAQHHRS